MRPPFVEAAGSQTPATTHRPLATPVSGHKRRQRVTWSPRTVWDGRGVVVGRGWRWMEADGGAAVPTMVLGRAAERERGGGGAGLTT